MKLATITFLLLGVFHISFSQTAPNSEHWSDISEADLNSQDERWIVPSKYRTLQLQFDLFSEYVRQAPLRNSVKAESESLVINIPLPDGSSQNFLISESPIMEAPLAEQYPGIKTFSGEGIDDPYARIYLDYTPSGFHAMILRPAGSVFIDPYYRGRTDIYTSYYKKDFLVTEETKWECLFENTEELIDKKEEKKKEIKIGTPKKRAAINLKTYRIAIAANGQYSDFHGNTISSVLAAINTALNRIRGVYETELAISFTLIATNELIICLSPCNDLGNTSGALIGAIQSYIDTRIGSANYDVGHVFSTGGGGVASLGVICSGSKARGVTGLSSPTGDPFYIDYVAHEMGHQFAGNHTFNGSSGSCSGGNRNGSTAYEPGSGSTIQAYAGICSPQNIQSNSDAYFHLVSLNEMTNHITNQSGANCGTDTDNGNNGPTADANFENIDGKSIPINTPFELTGSATDPDVDMMTFSWEEWDLGPQGNISNTSTTAPNFRTFFPDASPTRVFPQLSDILNNTTTFGEILSAVARDFKFQFIARDNRVDGGGYDSDLITLHVVDTGGPFAVTSPNTGASQMGNITITWNTVGTENAPISCANVDILISEDGGLTFEVLLADVTNDGSQEVTLPNVNTSTARIKVKCSDNVFFDISDTDFTIVSCMITNISAQTQGACVPGTNTYTQDVEVTYTNPPATGSLIVNSQIFAIATSPQTVQLTNLQADDLMVDVTASFSDDPGCTLTIEDLFTAPQFCAVCDITDVSAGAQTSCNLENTYTQEVVVTYDKTLGSGDLIVNGQSFTKTSSPQLVQLINLPANGANVNVEAHFSDNTSCSHSENNLFSAPSACISCVEYVNTDVPKSILDQTSVVSTLNVPSGNGIADVSILNLKGSHTQLGDLSFSLTSPEGTIVNIIDAQCSDEDNFDINLDDAAVSSIVCPYNDGQTSTPDSDLSGFDGEDPIGNWTLTVTDNSAGNVGTLNSWTLRVCTTLGLQPCNVFSGEVNGVIASGTYRSHDEITSTGTVNSGNVEFEAKNYVLMDPNFIVNPGALFQAEIKDCIPAAFREGERIEVKSK